MVKSERCLSPSYSHLQPVNTKHIPWLEFLAGSGSRRPAHRLTAPSPRLLTWVHRFCCSQRMEGFIEMWPPLLHVHLSIRLILNVKLWLLYESTKSVFHFPSFLRFSLSILSFVLCLLGMVDSVYVCIYTQWICI